MKQKDKTIQKAIVLLYLRMRRARKDYQRALAADTAVTPNQIALVGATDRYIETRNALEVMKQVLWDGEHPFVGREYRFMGRKA